MFTTSTGNVRNLFICQRYFNDKCEIGQLPDYRLLSNFSWIWTKTQALISSFKFSIKSQPSLSEFLGSFSRIMASNFKLNCWWTNLLCSDGKNIDTYIYRYRYTPNLNPPLFRNLYSSITVSRRFQCPPNFFSSTVNSNYQSDESLIRWWQSWQTARNCITPRARLRGGSI